MPSRVTGTREAAPHASRVALLLVDVINGMQFPEGERLARHARPAALRIAKLKQRAKTAHVPVVYANDNYGQWRSDFRSTLEAAIGPDAPGREISLMLAPTADDYFVLKPRHSAFYASALELLLSELGAECVILAGFAGDICVLFTAQDAYVRGFEIVMASDGIASETTAGNRRALELCKTRLNASVIRSSRIDLAALRRGG